MKITRRQAIKVKYKKEAKTINIPDEKSLYNR